MGIFDFAGRTGGNPQVNTANIGQALNTTGRLPWSSGFEGMNALTDEERRKLLMMQMAQQQAAMQRFVPLPSGRR